MSASCPVCSNELAGGELILVCAGCHERLGDGVPVGMTGEFRVPSEAIADAGVDDVSSSGSIPGAKACSWCGKAAANVKKLLGTGPVAICEGCVGLCAEILDAELGPGWR